MPIRRLPIESPPRRVVSLVPSLTESFFDLGLGEWVVAISDYCIHPAGSLAGLPRVGGPKNPDIERIQALRPDLVVANQEENSKAGIQALQRLGIPVWLTFPLTVEDALGDLKNLADCYRSESALRQVRGWEHSLEVLQTGGQNQPAKRVFCPIWQDQTADGQRWWMTFNRQTYPQDVLRRSGGLNVFQGRDRRYPLAADLGTSAPEDPGERDTRYPRVCLAEIVRRDPEVLLLPDEPYAFSAADEAELKAQLEARLAHPVRVERVDGSLLFWPGTRVWLALERLRAIFAG